MPPPRPQGSFLSPALPRVFAHRGLALEAPENTLLAFRAAAAIGAQYIETDVHASRDGIAVIAHDADLSRVASSSIRVRRLSMTDLRAVDLGHGQGFCSLAETLDAFPSIRFNIDVKSRGAVAPTIEAIRAAGATDRVLVTSFSESRRSAVVGGLPGVATSASARKFTAALLAGRVNFSAATASALRGISAVQVPERAIGIRVASERMLRLVHHLGVEMHIWTVNDPIHMAALLDLGVDGLITDRADLALELIRERRRVT